MDPLQNHPNPQLIVQTMSLMSPAGICLLILVSGALFFFTRALTRRRMKKSDLYPPIVMILALMASLLLARSLLFGASGILAEFSKDQNRVIQSQLRQSLEERTHALVRMGERWAFGLRYSKKDWLQDCGHYIRDLPGIGTIVWANADGITSWACPEKPGKILEGYDLRKDPVRYQRFLSIKANEHPIFSETRRMRTGMLGFALNQPLFVNGKFDGILGAIFDVQSLFNESVNAPDYDVHILENDRLIYDSDETMLAKDAGKWLPPTSFTYDTLHWRILTVPKPATIDRERRGWPEITLWIGCLCAILLAGTVRSSLKEKEAKDHLWKALAWERESKELEKRLAEQQAKVAESAKLAALGEMASGVAHEINNPLAVISGKAQLLKKIFEGENFDLEAGKKQVDSIQTTVKRITRIISGMQSFARDATSDPFSSALVSDIVDDTVAFCAERFRRQSIDLRLNQEDPRLEIACRPAQISQVLLNLLNNAFDAAQESPAHPRWVELDVRGRENGVEISVSDSGAGVPSELRERIMLPFFTTKAVGKGTGLGLSIAHGIVAEHGGRLYLDAAASSTRFVAWLPSVRV